MPTMLPRDDARLAWLRGTPLGRLVVPLVWRKRAMSSGGGAFGLALALQCCAFPCQADCPVTRFMGLDTEESELLSRSPRGMLLRRQDSQ